MWFQAGFSLLNPAFSYTVLYRYKRDFILNRILFERPFKMSTTLQLCRIAAAVGNTIYVRSQMTDSRQHAESTTQQPCRTAAAVGTPLVCDATLCCGELLVPEPVIIRHPSTIPTIPHVSFCCAAALGARVHRCENIGIFVIVII